MGTPDENINPGEGITQSPPNDGPIDAEANKNATIQTESLPTTASKWKLSKGDGDVAMKLFSSPDDLHEPFTEEEERKLVWKIDLLILPYLAVCYAFFYIDKTTLSYAAIFGIQQDLKLHGK